MGHSAGGHLALLYAYKSAAGDKINGLNMHPISLVISEAGPTNFTKEEVENLPPKFQNEICAMAGISSLNDTNAQIALNAVSPYCVAEKTKKSNKTLPNTILAIKNKKAAIEAVSHRDFLNIKIYRKLHFQAEK